MLPPEVRALQILVVEQLGGLALEHDRPSREHVAAVDAECRPSHDPAEGDERRRLARVCRWYLAHAFDLARSGTRSGTKEHKANYQVFCGPALGAFNQWVKGTPLAAWRSRHVDVVADRILEGAAELLNRQLRRFAAGEDAERS